MHKVRDVATAGDSGDWTDPAVALTGPGFPLTNRASGVRFGVVAVSTAGDGPQMADAGITFTYQIVREWTRGGVTRRAYTSSQTGTVGRLIDDSPVNRGCQGTDVDLYFKISGFSSTAGVNHFELYAEGL